MNKLKEFFHRRPLISNIVVYGSLYTGGEFSQQTLVKKVFVKNDESRQSYDLKSLGRFAIYGTCFLAPGYHVWYKWLDGRFVGAANSTVAVKLFVDQFLMTPPVLALFYMAMNFLENKPDIWEETRKKWLPTYMASCAFWIPAQTVNFKFLPSQLRVAYIGSCSFIWVNVLCYIKQKAM